MNEFMIAESMSTEPERVNEKIFLNLLKLSQIYRKTLSYSNEAYDLSPNELGLMMIMYLDSSINTANQIVKLLGTTKGLASRNVDNLTKKGLIKTSQDEKDRRIIRLFLCDEAKEICEEIRSKNDVIYQKSFEGIDMGDILLTLSTLQKMVENIR